jgi:hypothetical protein
LNTLFFFAFNKNALSGQKKKGGRVRRERERECEDEEKEEVVMERNRRWVLPCMYRIQAFG